MIQNSCWKPQIILENCTTISTSLNAMFNFHRLPERKKNENEKSSALSHGRICAKIRDAMWGMGVAGVREWKTVEMRMNGVVGGQNFSYDASDAREFLCKFEIEG
jgi:hypothetical protein